MNVWKVSTFGSDIGAVYVFVSVVSDHDKTFCLIKSLQIVRSVATVTEFGTRNTCPSS
jgi:hypothetical protein